MPRYQYRAYDASGKDTAGTIDAVSSKDAVVRLKQDGLYPRELEALGGGKGPGIMGGARVPAMALATMTRQLSTLLAAGTPIYDALRLLSSVEESAALSRVIIRIGDDISGGASLTRAMEAHPSVFPQIYVRTVEAGEASGSLDTVLLRLAEHMEARSRLREKVSTALMYPALMTAVGAFVLVFLFVFVLPKITRIFEDTRQALPLSTTALLFLINALRGYWYLFIIFFAAVYFGARRFMKRPGGRAFVDRALLGAPLAGKLIVKFHMASFSRTLGSLLGSGVPMLQALDMTRRVVRHSVYEEALGKTIMEVTEGASLSGSMRGSGVFPGFLTHMIATGERSGELDSLLIRAADAYEKDFETAVARALALLEPALILAMGAVVAFIVISVLLPIFELNQVIR